MEEVPSFQNNEAADYKAGDYCGPLAFVVGLVDHHLWPRSFK
jgi:hypothetical protein